jgi:hypothetical protein
MILNKCLIRSDLKENKRETYLIQQPTSEEVTAIHKRCSSSCYAQTKVQFKDLQTILYAKGWRNFQATKLKGLKNKNTKEPKPIPSQSSPQI